MRVFDGKRGLTPIMLMGALLAIASATVFAHHGWSGYKEVIEMSATVI